MVKPTLILLEDISKESFGSGLMKSLTVVNSGLVKLTVPVNDLKLAL